MVRHHGALMDAQPVRHRRAHLVGSQILVRLLQADVVPDKIFRAVQMAIFHVPGFQPHGGQMVAVHDEHRLLLPLGQGGDQLFHKLIHLIQLIYIIFPLVPFFLRFSTGDLDHRIGQHLLLRIGPVALDRNRVNIIRPLAGIQTLQNVPGEDAVVRPARLRPLRAVHGLDGRKRVKSQVGKHFIAAIKFRRVVVDGVGPVADLFQCIGHALAGRFFQNGFIRVFSRSKIVQVHAHDRLELGVGRPGAHHRHLEIAGGIFLHIPVKIRDRILGQLDAV